MNNSKIIFLFKKIQNTKIVEEINNTIHKKAYSYIYSNERKILEIIKKVP